MSSLQTSSFSFLSKYRSAGLLELIFLSAPITFILFSGCFMGFCDRFFLARYSLEALEGCVNASNLCQLFQVCLSFCTATAQVFVAQCLGARVCHKAGSYVWQMIWFSFLSVFLVIPLGFIAEYLFFADTSVKESGMIYFRCLMPFNFLFPLGTALSSFYFGQAKMKTVMWATFAANVLNICLDPLLIFGIPGWIPEMGILGAALATGISQAFFCFCVMLRFLNRKNREVFGTGDYRLKWDLFKECVRVGFPRCISKLAIFCAWLANVRLMTLKGGDFLLTLSLISSLSLLFSYINDGMGQGLITIASYLIGKNDYSRIKKLVRTGLLFMCISATIVLLPCIIFSKQILNLFFIEAPTPEQMKILVQSCYWLWVFFVSYGVGYIPYAILIALGDTFFNMVYNIFSSWALSYVPVLLTIHMLDCTPDKLYLVMALSILSSAFVYFIRLRTLKWKPLVSC